MNNCEQETWKTAIELYDAQSIEKQVEVIRFSERLITENQDFLNETGAQITVSPFNQRYGQADFIVNVPNEEQFIKSLKNPNEPVIFLGEANEGKLDLNSSFITPNGSNLCGWNHSGKVENVIEHQAYELQKIIVSSCLHLPNGGNSAYTTGSLYFNIGNFSRTTNIHVVFKYLWKYYYEWDFSPRNKYNDSPNVSVKINLLQVQNGKVINIDRGGNFEFYEILRNAPNMAVVGVQTISPTLKTKAETFNVQAGQGFDYVVQLSAYCYTWPNDGSTFIKNDFQLVPYS